MKPMVTDENAPALVLLHGWGAHGGVWDGLASRLAARLRVFTPDLQDHGSGDASASDPVAAAVDRIAATAPACCAVAGWSLGGQLALEWARRHPQQVTRLVLMATTPRFVSAPDWPHGMAAGEFSGFSAALERDAAATLRRFLLLQAQGDVRARVVTRRLEAALEGRPLPGVDLLRRTLRWLQHTDLREALPAIEQPVLVLHGDRDRITPLAAGEYLAAQLREGRVEQIAGAAHALFFSDPDGVSRRMNDFCNEH